ncbi:MAG: hypothetical protein KF774_12280 [Planctomyces sp.]|nr:hypothetical protein [Planctomyces sp.]
MHSEGTPSPAAPRTDGPRRSRSRSPGGLSAALIAASLGMTGCGGDLYDSRLARTAELFEYRDQLDQALQGTWSRDEFGLRMRIPRGYVMLPPPPPPVVLEDGTIEAAADDRHPGFLGIELPGLVDAWRLPNVGSLYICSNHQRFVDQMQTGVNAADPNTLLTDVELALQQGLRFTLDAAPAGSPSDVNARFVEKIPAVARFEIPKDFLAITISGEEIENLDPLAAQVYEYTNGPVQVAIVCIYLKSARVNPDRALRLALETLKVDGQPPRASAAGGARGGGGTNF